MSEHSVYSAISHGASHSIQLTVRCASRSRGPTRSEPSLGQVNGRIYIEIYSKMSSHLVHAAECDMFAGNYTINVDVEAPYVDSQQSLALKRFAFFDCFLAGADFSAAAGSSRKTC